MAEPASLEGGHVAEVEFTDLDAFQMSTRNHGMPLEALRFPVTPVGLHYLLVHYDIPVVDAGRWRLEVGGAVRRQLSLDLGELRERPSVEVCSTMECAGNGRARLTPRPASQPWLLEAVGTACWRGVPLCALLDEAGVRDEAVEVLFTGLDRGLEGGTEQVYQRSLPLEEALREEILLAYEMNGEALPPQHGYPLRLVVPGWYGMTNVKWLAAVTVLDRPFTGYQHEVAYRFRRDDDDPGVPVTRMLPRALMVPPGIPDFLTRRRVVPPGPQELTGRAWSGHAPVAGVEVSDDGGATWAPARVTRDLDSPWAWAGWTLEWDPEPGEYVLRCRARDEAGNVQPLEQVWNVGGYANNAVQALSVTVVEAAAGGGSVRSAP
jgi:DMSO/TMAO reductase YedYZ molybdopterin-dependent catalytic subunit